MNYDLAFRSNKKTNEIYTILMVKKDTKNRRKTSTKTDKRRTRTFIWWNNLPDENGTNTRDNTKITLNTRRNIFINLTN